MNKNLLSLFFLLSFPVFFTGCTEQLAQDVNRLQVALADMRKLQAEQNARIDELEAHVRTTSGRLETIEYSQNTKIGGDLNALKQNLSELGKRVPPPALVPALLLEQDEQAAQTLPEELSRVIGQALQFIREGKYEDAELRLREALELSRGTAWAADCLFWSGVTLEGLKREKDALRAYTEIVAQYKKHRKAPQALLRQSAIFVRMGDEKIAKITLKKLIADYPKTEEAARAKERLKDL